ncbi:SprT family protein [Salirhabdus sp. Marseille-P4669]|uniref:SprT family protein n=1 Tax=Salirhabdus sp. Marseille-P4669 TaxID=2042310 RepID=UPI000C7956B1|nr:SprT family protein [Salirhabdus sp. Marseille-P4669]
MNNEELLNLVKELSLKHFGKLFIDKAVFNNRLRTTGGRYIPSRRIIEINPKYLSELGIEELIGIIKHELCHYHLHIEGKGYQHRDADFRELLKQTNSPRHCKSLPSMKNRGKYSYKCSACGAIFHRVRRVNITRYRCGRCMGKLKSV